MVSLLIYIVIIAVLVGLAYWVIDVIPVPEPVNKIAKVLIIVVGVIALIWVLMGIAGNPPALPR